MEIGMTGDPSSALAILTSVADGTPPQVRTALVSAFSQLFGGLAAIPAAWLKRKAQSIEDLTAARSVVSVALAKSVAEKSVADPATLEAAAEIFLSPHIRKKKNLVQIALMAAEHTADKCDTSSAKEAKSPEDDWMNSFARFAEDASSERMQDMFSRLLAGEIVRPGAYSVATMRTISEMDQELATDFSYAWAKSVGEAVDFNAEWQRGDGFSRWKRLAEAGLMAQTQAVQYLPPFKPFPGLPGVSLWSPMYGAPASLIIQFPENCAACWTHIMFTRVGRQLGSLIAPPDWAANMRAAAVGISQQGVHRIELFANDLVETLFEKN